MCGILGIVSKKDIIKPMIDGLKKLAYRGYDSSGLATINDQTIIKRMYQHYHKFLRPISISENHHLEIDYHHQKLQL